MYQLNQLSGLSAHDIATLCSYRFTQVTTDSRKVDATTLFFALPGVGSHGWDYLEKVQLQGGLVAIVPEHRKAVLQANLSQGALVLVGVEDPITCLAHFLSHVLNRYPPHLIAVTGTNGKSSISYYVAQMSQAFAIKSGFIGTFGVGALGELVEATQTTPDILTLHTWLDDFYQQGIECVAFEASSHALDQRRLEGVPIRTAIFSNLSRDHLDYHGSMMMYALAKQRLFSMPSLSRVVINIDDSYADFMLSVVTCAVYRVSLNQDDADFYVRHIEYQPDGIGCDLITPMGCYAVFLPLFGQFNLSNALLALAAIWDIVPSKLGAIKALSGLSGAPGRMQILREHNKPTVVIDYAHTPDALTCALAALRQHTQGRLICVFGCGGDRDPGKRPLMLSAALANADEIWLTSDNPRGEDPHLIIQQACQGIHSDTLHVQVERRIAIEEAIMASSIKDTVLVAGKGHETYQDILGIKYHFDDVEESIKVLANYVG